jgi:hypothetical protein
LSPAFSSTPRLRRGIRWNCSSNGTKRGNHVRVRAEQLIYNRVTKQTLSEGPWVYTGSVFQSGNIYLAETEGTLVGFMHTTGADHRESPD